MLRSYGARITTTAFHPYLRTPVSWVGARRFKRSSSLPTHTSSTKDSGANGNDTESTAELAVVPEWDRGGKSKAQVLSPLLASMRKLIDQNKGCVSLIQVGSFYELYFEQAEFVAPKLGIRVATRKTGNHAIPMAGFPVSQLQKFVKIIVQDLQVNVAVIDQFDHIKSDDDLKHRKVSRIVSPGTLVDESFMNYSKNNYLVAISPNFKPDSPPDLDATVGLLWVDVSVGELSVQQTTLGELAGDLRRIGPSEVIISKDFHPAANQSSALIDHGELKKYFVRYHNTTYRDYKMHFGLDVVSTRKVLEDLSLREEAAMNLVLSYVNVNLPDRQLLLDPPVRYVNSRYLNMDSRTRDALEITGRSTFGSVSVVGTLLNTIKATVTPSGTRLLTQWVKLPILDEAEIGNRLQFVELFYKHPVFRLEVANQLAQVGDFVRSIQKLALNSGVTLYELNNIAIGVTRLADVRSLLTTQSHRFSAREKKALQRFVDLFIVPTDIADDINNTIFVENAVVSEVKTTAEYFTELLEERLRSASEEMTEDTYKAEKKTQAKETSYDNLFSVRKDYNSTIKADHEILEALAKKEEAFLDKILTHCTLSDPKATVTHKEQLGRHFNVIAVTTKSKVAPALAKSLAEDLNLHVREAKKTSLILDSHEWNKLLAERDITLKSIMDQERKIINDLKTRILSRVLELRAANRSADFLDITSSFGKLAKENNWVRPEFTTDNILEVEQGRHAVVESSLRDNGQNFVPNNTLLGSCGRLWVISGPNMGGKSTFLRQNALIVIMAQIGCFVPASKARLLIVDRLFTRIGASDDIFSDLSTFMVEMIEISNILTNASPRSLAIVDEIGRGTGGKEGLAIAYATLVSLLHENKCRTLFATHFGLELKSLLDSQDIDMGQLRFYRTKIADTSTKGVTFDRQLEPGISERSFALDVAKLAGFPTSALIEAQKALTVIQSTAIL